METKDAYKQKLEAQLKEWEAQIKLLAAKMENAGADARLKYAQELEKLRATQHEAIEKLKELDAAGIDVWDKLKESADKTWDEMKHGIANLLSKFK